MAGCAGGGMRATKISSAGTSIWNTTSSPAWLWIAAISASVASVNGARWRNGPAGPKVNSAMSKSPGMPT